MYSSSQVYLKKQKEISISPDAVYRKSIEARKNVFCCSPSEIKNSEENKGCKASNNE